MKNEIAVLLVLYNDVNHLKVLLDSLFKQEGVVLTIFAVDCHPSQESLQYLKSKNVTSICFDFQGNLGYSAGNNFLVKEARKRGFSKAVICNTDVILEKKCIFELSENLTSEYIAAGPLVYYGTPENTKGLHSYVNTVNFKDFSVQQTDFDCNVETLPDLYNTNALTGCLMMINVELFNKYALFPEEAFMYGEELDLSIKLYKQHQKLLCVKGAVAWHNHKEKSSKILYDYSYYYIKRNFILTCKRYHNTYALRLSLYHDFIKLPQRLILASKKHDFKGLKYYYKGILDGLKNIKGMV